MSKIWIFLEPQEFFKKYDNHEFLWNYMRIGFFGSDMSFIVEVGATIDSKYVGSTPIY